MQFRPRFDQPALPSGQAAREQLDRIYRENSHVVLIVGVNVWRVVWPPDFHEHANDDAEEPTDLWHRRIVSTIEPFPSAPGHSFELRLNANLQRFWLL